MKNQQKNHSILKFVSLYITTVIGICLFLTVTALAGESVGTDPNSTDSTTQKRSRVEQLTKTLQDVVNFLTDDVLTSFDPTKARGQEVSGRDILDAASEGLEGVLEDEPLLEASIRYALGSAYHRLSYYEAAKPHLIRALEIRREELGEEHPYTLSSMRMLAWLYLRQGRYEEAEPLYIKTLEGRRRVLGDEHIDTLISLRALGVLYRVQGRYDEAEAIYVNGIETFYRVLGDEHPETLLFIHELGWLYLMQRRLDQAETQFTKSLEIQRRILGNEHPDTLDSIHAKGGLYIVRGEYDKAEPLLIEAVATGNRIFGNVHSKVGTYTRSLASLYIGQGRYSEAEELLLEAVTIRRRELGDENLETTRCISTLFNLYQVWNKLDKIAEWQAKLQQTQPIKSEIVSVKSKESELSTEQSHKTVIEVEETPTADLTPIIVDTEVIWRIAESQQSFSADHTLEEIERILRSYMRDTLNRIIGRHYFLDFVNYDIKIDQIQDPEEAFVRAVTEAGFINSETSESKVNLIQDEMLTVLQQSVSASVLGIEIEKVFIKQIRLSEEIQKDLEDRKRVLDNRERQQREAEEISQQQAERE